MLRNILTKIAQNKLTRCQFELHQCFRRNSTVVAVRDEYQLVPEQIEEAVKLNPTLASIGVGFWQRAHKTFANHGLPTLSFLRIVHGNPAVLRRSPQRNIESLEQWRGCQFGEKYVHLLLTKYPEMLDVDESQSLHTHIIFLKSHLLTQKNVWKVLMNSPDVMEQSEQTISEKIDYLRRVMRLEVPEIVKSAAMSKSLLEIRTRHVFQERLGIFKPRSLKVDPNEPTSNDRLYKITDTSEKTFANKICHVSLEEYEAFKELYSREIASKGTDLDEDDFSDGEIIGK